MKRYAIIAATDEYIHINGTPYCHSDALLLSETLREYCDFAEQDIFLDLLSPQKNSSPLEILERIKSVASRLRPGDTVLFYYAGHGTVHENEPYLVLPSTEPGNLVQTALPLRDISQELKVQGCINVRMFDSCHSGFDIRRSDPLADGAAFLRAVTQLPSGWLTLAACSPEEYSHADPSLQHGVFTYYLCDVIRSLPEGSEILPEFLKVDVCKRVQEWCETTQQKQQYLDQKIGKERDLD